MKAIILAAGRGSRLKGLTNDRPKCLVPFLGKPLLQYQREALSSAGISEIAIVTGYCSEKLPRDLKQFNNPDWETTNMVYSLCRAAEWLESDECVISYSDIVYSADAVSRLSRNHADIAITYDSEWKRLWEHRFSNPLDDAETFKLNSRRELVEIGLKPKSLDEVQGQYMGLLKFTPAGWTKIEKTLSSLGPERVRTLQMTQLLNHLLQAETPIATVEVKGNFYEIDSEEDLRRSEKLVISGNKKVA